MRYRRAVFDGDGTLAETFPWLLRAVNRLADAHGCNRIAADDLDTLRGSGARQVVVHLGVPAWKLPRIGIDMRRLMAADNRHIRLFDGIGVMLRGLSERGVALAVVTSNACDNLRHVLGAEHAALIRHYACGASLFGKRGHLRRVLKQSGVRPGEAIFIGDELRDLEAARAEGIPFGAVAWGDTHAVSVHRLYGFERCNLQSLGVFPLSAPRHVGEPSSWSETAFQQPLVFCQSARSTGHCTGPKPPQ